MSESCVRYRGASGAERFSDAVARSLVRQEIDPLDPVAGFDAELTGLRLGRYDVVRAVVPALRASRRPDPGSDGTVFVLRSRRGRGTIRLGGTVETITPERLVVVAADEPFVVDYPTGADLVFVTIPAVVVDHRLGPLRDQVRRFDLDRFDGRMLSMVIDEAADRTGAGPVPGPALADLLDSALALCVDGLDAEPDDLHRLLRHRALRLIADAEHPASLNPGVIAGRLNISVRQLHRCFDGGPSVSSAIRERRLDDAARLLLDEPNLSVAGVAAQVGFATGSHLATHFRDAYGTSPAGWRDRARS